MATIVGSSSGLEFRSTIQIPISGGTAVPATGSNNYIITRLDRRVRFREFGVIGQQTLTTGFPATNFMTCKLFNITKATLMASGTVIGIGGNPTQISLGRGIYAQLATLNEFVGSFAVASAQDVLELQFTATVTLSRGLISPIVQLIGDFID